MAAHVLKSAPEEWVRGRVRASRAKDSPQCRAEYELRDGETLSLAEHAQHAQRALGKPAGTLLRHLSLVELSVEPSGRFEAFTSEAVDRSADGQDRLRYVLKPGTPLPDTGDEQDGPADPTPAGDPDEAVRLFRDFFHRSAEILGYGPEPGTEFSFETDAGLAAPLDAAQREEQTAAADVTLPADLLALYALADGDDGDYYTGIFAGYMWFDLAYTLSGTHYRSEGDWTDGDPLSPVLEASPPETVRRSPNRRGWIPFAGSEKSDCLAVDMDPGPNGRPGQVIRLGGDDPCVYIADSVTTFVRRQVAALDRGDYFVHGDEHLDVDAGFREAPAPGDTAWWRVEDGSLRDMPRDVQCVTAWEAASGTDLEPLRGAPLLREVNWHGQGSLDLAPLRDTPLESLRLTLESVDLTPLTGHPTLRVVELGTERPVDLGALRTLPRLQGLDLSRAVVSGTEVIAELDGLLFLCLSYEQWRELGEQIGALSSLAAVGLGGTPSPSEIHTWTTLFAADPARGGHQLYTGR
ncbi:SMI1/KNR4 family protein [Streptomyces sp. NPDC048483]|uniref:SMI1/KNR4 family protein n=1 Tax=Streptomyces sp. NPDC048483 TaxID=3154927 RepID=UPI0034495956